MVDIKNKSAHDPVTDLNVADSYMRWALQATEEVVGKDGLNIMLRDAKLDRFVNNYPPDAADFKSKVTCGEYANLNAALLGFYGRAGKGMVLRIGRLSAKRAIDQQSAMFGVVALMAAKLLPVPMRIKMLMERMQDGFEKLNATIGQTVQQSVEDRGDKLAYINHDCPVCAGKEAGDHICWLFNGALMEGTHWLTGKDFEVEQVECRAMGANACVWEVSKKPKE